MQSSQKHYIILIITAEFSIITILLFYPCIVCSVCTFQPTGVMFINWLCRWCICSDSFLSIITQPYAGCCSPCLCFQLPGIRSFLAGMTDNWHVIPLTSSSVHIGCVTVYLIIISCYSTAMTSPSYPSTKNAHVIIRVHASTHSL